MRYFLLIYFFILSSSVELNAQIYHDYFGTGNEVGISTTSSPSESGDSLINTLNGTGYLIDRVGAYRLLTQASFGASVDDVDTLIELGVENWIDWQINIPHRSFFDHYKEIFDTVSVWSLAVDSEFNPNSYRRSDLVTYTFFDKMFSDSDRLRQKAAFALTQIFVINRMDGINGLAFGIADYYDIFYSGAFGNYREMIEEMAYHPIMGRYLSHFKNQKTNNEGARPDENFAREIMQLFTIGLHELNNDGTLKLDSGGKTIPTYNIHDVEEMAKVFTGLSGGALAFYSPVPNGVPAFNMNDSHVDYTARMAMYTEHHETSGKNIFDNDLIIPANQSGEQDIEDVLDYLFNHPNVGPFISLRLIQQLVKSNPSPQYINRVATVFNDNGNGVRGDMGAVFKVILTDKEARDCELLNATSGRMLQPIERLTNLMFALDMKTPSGKFWFDDRSYYFYLHTDQAFLSSPSVFNFFSPFYVHDDCVADNDMYSPEFQLLTSRTAISYINMLNGFIHGFLFKYSNHTKVETVSQVIRTNGNTDDTPYLNYDPLVDVLIADGTNGLMDYLNLIFCRGQLSDISKTIIVNTLNDYQQLDGLDNIKLVKEAIYFIMLTPDYLILK